jgi:UDP-glucuronate 4-epimerase
MNILVTGAAGFIGFHCCRELLKQSHKVVGIDNVNNYYDVNLKLDRLNELGINSSKVYEHPYTEFIGNDENFRFFRLDIADDTFFLDKLFERYKFDCVINLAAQAGVRYSIK